MTPPPAPPTPADGPVDWIVAARPDAPGAAEALAAPRRVLFTGLGLTWLERAPLLAPLLAAGADLALCSASARDWGLTAEHTPPGVRWSSVATWMAELGPRPAGAVLP
jgi:hypothetical protein